MRSGKDIAEKRHDDPNGYWGHELYFTTAQSSRRGVCKTFTSDLHASDASVIEPSSVPVKSNSTDVIITPHALAAGPCSLNLSLQYGKPAVAIVHYVYNFEVSNKRSVLRNAKRERSSEVLPVVMEGDVTPL